MDMTLWRDLGPGLSSQGRQFKVIPFPDSTDGCDFMMGPGPAIKADNLGSFPFQIPLMVVTL
eukprot:10525170-Karenia_brevis.AAC.1